MRWALCGIVLIALCPGTGFCQGRIEQIRRDASRPAEPVKDETEERSDCPSDPEDEDVFGFGAFIGAIFTGPFVAPRKAAGDDWDVTGYFPGYPYFNRHRGHLYFPDHNNRVGPESETLRVRKWSLRVSSEEGNDFRGMNRVGIRASLDTSSRLGLSSNWNLLTESLEGGRHDSLWLSDTNVTFRFAQSEKVQFHTGLGVRFLSDSSNTRAGVNFLYGVDFFPREPITASVLFDLGNVGSAFIWHGRATIGAAWRHFDLYAGYDFMRVDSVNVQGPMIGLRFWY